MDKLKKVFSPGASKDDEVLYGDAETRRQASVANAQQAGTQQESQPLRPVEGGKESGGVLRQILNPGGEKHDDHAYGTNATTEPADPKHIQTHPEHSKDHTILGQILNPGGDKYDEKRFGETGVTGGDTRRGSERPEAHPSTVVSSDAKLATDDQHKDHSILRQIINPGGANYDSVAYGGNASVVGADEHQARQNDLARREDKSSISRQILNPNQEKYDPVVHGAGQSTTSGSAPTASASTAHGASYAQPGQQGSSLAEAGSSSLPDRTAQTSTTHDSHLGRDAAVVGGVGAAGAGTYAATRHQDNDPSTTTQDSSQAAYPQSTNQSQQPSSTTHTTTHTTMQTTNPQSTYQPASQQPDHSNLGRDAAIAGGVGAAGAGTYAATRHHNEQERLADPPATAQSTASSAYSQPGYQSTPQHGDNSHLGRDAAVVGGLGAAGAGAYAATRHENEPRGYADTSANTLSSDQTAYPQSTSEYTPQTAGTGPSIGLSQHNNPIDSDSSSKITDRPHPLSNRGNDDHINPINAPEASESQVDSHLGRDAAVLGGSGIAGGTAASHLHSSSHPVGSGPLGGQTGTTQLNQAPADVQNATYTDRSTHLGGGAFGTARGPHQTDTANRLDPHVPGEFPTETGDDPHGVNPTALYAGERNSGTGLGPVGGNASSQPTIEHHYGRDAALGGAGLATAGAATYGLSEHDRSGQVPNQTSAATSHPGGQSYPVATPSTSAIGTSAPSQTLSTQAQPEHHYGRDAALGGAAVAGVGGTAYGLSQHDQSRQVPAQPSSATSYPSGQSHATPSTAVDATGSNMPTQEQSAHPTSQHHYGRDAAVAGGAGAAGFGAYEASKGHDSTGPASKTIGPHDSNIANVVDPRVQPDPQQMKQSTTSGPYQSDMANKADPRVDSSKHEQGRDAAALAGGAGAGAAAGYGASQLVDDKEQRKLEKQHQKEIEQEHKQAEKEAAKEEKAHQKEAAKQEKQHEKEVAKHEKQQQKEIAKEEKKAEKQHEKEIAKQEKQHEKEVAKQEKQHEKELAKEGKHAEKEREKHEKEAAAAAGATGVGAGAYEAEKHHQAGSEQPDPSSYDTNESGQSGEKKRGLLDKILHPTRKSEDDNRVAADGDGHNKLHKKHAPKAAEHPQHSPQQPTHGEDTQYSSPSQNQEGLVAGPEYGSSSSRHVTEPHTGLPMNTAQYGSGAGGTDGAEQIPGYHQHPSTTTASGAGEQSAATGPDWNAIKKENTPY